MKPNIDINKTFVTSDAEKRQMERKGFRYDPIRGFTNTRDPWWLPVWMIIFWAFVAALSVMGLFNLL